KDAGNNRIAPGLSVLGNDADGELVEARCQPRRDQVPTGIAVVCLSQCRSGSALGELPERAAAGGALELPTRKR
ncbi:MAG: hypothetical protein ABSE77_21605, partial [Acidimicrobiales bacterium]